MLANSKISHILLLCVMAYVIYSLTCPKTIKNKGTLEQIDSSSKKVSDEAPETKSVSTAVESETEASKGIVTEVEKEMKKETEPTKIHSFKGEDKSVGATLNAAFEKPVPKGTDTSTAKFNKNYLKKYDSTSYLPKEVNDEWFDTDFSQAKNKVGSDKLINTDKYIVGVDTVGQSLKNATYDLRGTVANPKYNVSPWLNSTYEPDYNIKPLC